MLFPLVNDMKNDLKIINHNAKHKRNRLAMGKQFAQFVQFHSKLLQLRKYSQFSRLFQMNSIVAFLFLQVSSRVFGLNEYDFHHYIHMECGWNQCNDAHVENENGQAIWISLAIKCNCQ